MSVDINSPESRRALAKMMIKLFDLWGIEAGDRLELLGLDADDPVFWISFGAVRYHCRRQGTRW